MISKVIKYIIYTIVFILAILYLVVYTTSGNSLVYKYLSYKASEESNLNIEVQSIDINSYPYIVSNILIEDKYKLQLKGKINSDNIYIDYTILSECLYTNFCNINDEIDIKGNLSGSYDSIYVNGEGRILDGKVHYHFNKQGNRLTDLNINIDELNSTKFRAILKEDLIFRGDANITIVFDNLSKDSKEGNIIYSIRDNNFSNLALDIKANIDIKDKNYNFSASIVSNNLTLLIDRGNFNQDTKMAHAFYTLDIKDLTSIEKLLGEKLVGSFYALGEIDYNKNLQINGLSKSLGGLIDFLYDRDTDTVTLNTIKVPSKNITKMFSQEDILDTYISGESIYHIKSKELTSNSKLIKTRIIRSKSTDELSKKLDWNITDEYFDDSSINIVYKDKVIRGNIKISNGTNHLILNGAKIYLNDKSIDSYINLKIKKHQLQGDIYTKIDDHLKKRENIYLKFDGSIDKYYRVKLDGLVNKNWINMDYEVSSHRLPSHICTIVDDVNITGYLNGFFDRMHITGKGSVMEGNISYDVIKIKDVLKDMKITMKDIHAKKFSTLLGGDDTLPNGKVDITIDFDKLSKKNKKGKATYRLKNGKWENLPLSLYTQSTIKDHIARFKTDGTFGNIEINMTKGRYNIDKEIGSSFYVMSSPDLSKLEEVLKSKYIGALSAVGEIKYNQYLKIEGVSRTYGGMVDFAYERDRLDINLNRVSFGRIISILDYPPMIEAETTGNINYNFTGKLLSVKTKLNRAKFLPSDLVDTIYDKADVNMSKESFNNSSLELTYHKNMILGDLRLTNASSYFLLTNVILNTNSNALSAYFDFKMQQQKFSGKVHGKIDKLKVNLNIHKLIEFQMDKQIDSMVGKENRKMMESMPMGTVAKDVATETAASFMGIFF
ncbi:MAG: hypothetical protein QM493_09735 [Sulfurovum sp.]